MANWGQTTPYICTPLVDLCRGSQESKAPGKRALFLYEDRAQDLFAAMLDYSPAKIVPIHELRCSVRSTAHAARVSLSLELLEPEGNLLKSSDAASLRLPKSQVET